MITRRTLFASLAGFAAAPTVACTRVLTYPEVRRKLGLEAALRHVGVDFGNGCGTWTPHATLQETTRSGAALMAGA
jgi:hypothetical protein